MDCVSGVGCTVRVLLGYYTAALMLDWNKAMTLCASGALYELCVAWGFSTWDGEGGARDASAGWNVLGRRSWESLGGRWWKQEKTETDARSRFTILQQIQHTATAQAFSSSDHIEIDQKLETIERGN